jgi:hypothetical protein
MEWQLCVPLGYFCTGWTVLVFMLPGRVRPCMRGYMPVHLQPIIGELRRTRPNYIPEWTVSALGPFRWCLAVFSLQL